MNKHPKLHRIEWFHPSMENPTKAGYYTAPAEQPLRELLSSIANDATLPRPIRVLVVPYEPAEEIDITFTLTIDEQSTN
jgi:hypothetical protein